MSYKILYRKKIGEYSWSPDLSIFYIDCVNCKIISREMDKRITTGDIIEVTCPECNNTWIEKVK